MHKSILMSTIQNNWKLAALLMSIDSTIEMQIVYISKWNIKQQYVFMPQYISPEVMLRMNYTGARLLLRGWCTDLE